MNSESKDNFRQLTACAWILQKKCQNSVVTSFQLF